MDISTDGILVDIQGSDLSKKLHLSWESLELSQGGNANKLTYFTHPSIENANFFCSDPDFLKQLKTVDDRHIQAQLPGLCKNKNKINRGAIAALSLLIFILSGLWMAKDPLVELAVDAIPLTWEETLGEQVMAQIKLSQPISSDSVLNDRIRQMTEPLLAQLGDRKFHFYLSGSNEVNAFAVPGGHVVVHRGLIEKAKSIEEIQGVLAHELQHVLRRHSMKNIMSSLGTILVLQTLLGDLTGLAAVLTEGSSFLLLRQFSRDFERDADDKGFDLLVASQIDPSGMVDFFKTLEKVKEERMKDLSNENKDRLETIEDWASTHPQTEDRIAHLQERLDLLGDTEWRESEFDLEALKEELSSANKSGDKRDEITLPAEGL